MNKIRMGTLDELRPGRILEKKILARRIAVINVDGTLHGIEADCKHMRASLTTGKISDGIITCKWHGWQYRLDTGECLTVPGVSLKRYEITTEDGVIYVHI